MALQFFIKNLCIEIQQECKSESIECHQNFMTYYLNLLAYDPLWNLFPKMKEIIRLDALRLIKYVVAKMHRQMCPNIVTLKIQFYAQCNFERKEDIVAVEETNFQLRLGPLIDDITQAKPANEVEYDLLLKQIIYYSTLWRGLGNPINEDVYKECYYATISVLDNSDLETFVHFKLDEKIQQLLELAAICGGVRIFNWTCKLGGQGIEDVPVRLAQGLSQIRTDVDLSLRSIMDRLDILTSAIDYCFVIEENEVREAPNRTCIEYKQMCELALAVEYEEVEFFKDLVIAYRQIEVYLRQVLDAVGTMESTYDSLGVEFQECLERFNALTHLKAGVPTSVIFPLFIDLDRIWECYQNEITYLKRLYKIHRDLDLYVKDFVVNFAKVELIIDDRDILNDVDRTLLPTSAEPLDEKMFDLEVITPNSEQYKRSETKLEVLGFDVWRLVESQGALIPGNPNLGIVVFDDKHYAFSCKQSAFMFAKYPKVCINEFLELARKKVELITLLNLREALAEVQTQKVLVVDAKVAESLVPTSHVRIQTEMHPVDSYIDHSYMWNLWDHKRAALKLCDISHSATKGTNTESTRGKMASATQTYRAKDFALQTMRDNYTNTHTPQTYFFGLRGRTDDKQFILDLTKPPEKS